MIPFSKPVLQGNEYAYIQQSLLQTKMSGDGPMTKRCHDKLRTMTGACDVLLTHSCTGALEMSALLGCFSPGDEVIVPSFTFVSTVNPFVMQGCVPVFVDIRPDTLNIDESKIEEAITSKTKAIVVMHYGGVACGMDTILALAAKHNLLVIEDAAQCLGASYKGKALGTLAPLGTLSFHDTKNIISGEGGALLINDLSMVPRAEMIREKGTDRSQMMRGEIDKYTWRDVGSSFLPNEITAAFLLAQLEKETEITQNRLETWHFYHDALKDLEDVGHIIRPTIPQDCQHNAHLYYIILKTPEETSRVRLFLKDQGVQASTHYIPLHDSPAGIKYGKLAGGVTALFHTQSIPYRLLRLPLWFGMVADERSRVVQALHEAFV